MPRESRSVVISTREEPERNSRMIMSRVFWSMSPCVADTVWSRLRILSVSQSTCAQARTASVVLRNAIDRRQNKVAERGLQQAPGVVCS